MEKFTYYLEMAQAARFSSGAFGDKHGARKLVQAFKEGKETYDMPNGDKYKLTKKVSSLDLTRGMIVLASYDATNQGAQVYEIKNIIDSKVNTILCYKFNTSCCTSCTHSRSNLNCIVWVVYFSKLIFL